MLEASRPLLFLDYLRIPYRVKELEPASHACLRRQDGEGLSLIWPTGDWSKPHPDLFEFDGVNVFARNRIVDAPGAAVLLPFDPDEAISNLWSEAYRTGAGGSGPLKRAALRSYYAVRPGMPRSVQIWLRRRFSKIQARTSFPRWPIETALHDLYDLLLRRVATVAGEPVPWIAPWPAPYSWALVLSHDVEQTLGYDNVHVLADIERELGYRSSWNFVPERDYKIEETRLEELRRDGFEIGVHGLHHDGRDLESRSTFEQRLPAIRAYAERWGAVGFRSPATHRDWDLMPLLGLDYDSSSPDTDPFEPISGGCCSWLPFFNRDLVELPITLTQDHTAFVILDRKDDSLWTAKAEFLRDRRGMALLLTHPDYMLDPDLVALYRGFLQRYATDDTAWKPLPLEVSDWWRRRAASRVIREESVWLVEGPAADQAQIVFADADGQAARL
jgi:hypothetical protein